MSTMKLLLDSLLSSGPPQPYPKIRYTIPSINFHNYDIIFDVSKHVFGLDSVLQGFQGKSYMTQRITTIIAI